MSFLGYVATGLLSPNLAGYLISKGLADREEKKLVKDIEAKIIEFNRNFDDKEVDSNYFVDFLEQNNVNTSIFDRVFNAHRSKNVDYQSLSESLASDAIIFVNEKKDKFGHSKVKRPSDFVYYFRELFDTLLHIRDSLLNIRGKAIVSTISDSLCRTEENVTQTIKTALGENYLLDEKIREVESLIDKGLYDESEELISEIFETVGSMSKEQRIRLLYQKVRRLINTGDYKKIPSLRRTISHYDSESKYIAELDYWVGCHEKDFNQVQLSIQQLREKGIEDYILDLKEVYYHLINGEYDAVLEKLLDESGEIKREYQSEASAYFQLGIVYLNTNKYELAEIQFKSALDIKYNISYDYNCIISRVIQFFREIKINYRIDDSVKRIANELSEELERTVYFIKDADLSNRLQHWWNYLNLLGISNPEKVLLKIGAIDEDLIDEELIAVVLSETYYLLGKYNEAKPYLERVWHLDSLFLIRLLHAYKELDEWELIETLLSKDIESHYDSEGIIYFYNIELLVRKNELNKAVELISHEGEKYKEAPWFVERVLRFSYENEINELHIQYLDYVKQLLDKLKIEERLHIGRTLYKQDEFEVLRKVLETVFRCNEEALGMYLYSFGEISTSNTKFDELKHAVVSLYDEGNKSEYVMHCKFYIEFVTGRFLDAMETLKEYRENIGVNTFYQLNIVQCVIFGSLDSDAFTEANALIDSNVLKHHLMAAQYYAYKGRWQDAKSILLRSIYRFSDDITEEEVSGFVGIYFNNVHQHNEKVEFEQACDDSVVTLRDGSGEISKYCIHTNDFMIKQNGEVKFDCVNYKNTSDKSLILKATGRKNSEIRFNGEEYTVVDIIDINTYFFGYFLNRLQVEYPDNLTIIPVSSDSIEGLVEKMTGFMKADNENTKTKLDFYNFGVETGTPITYLSGKDSDKYLETIYYLMNHEGQNFYSAYNNEITQGSKYVLTISSLVVLNALGYLDKVSALSDRIYITSSLKPFIRKEISGAIKYSESVVSTAFLDEGSNFRITESTEESKVFKKTFWTQILVAINDFIELKPENINTTLYDMLHEMVDVSEFEAIEVCKDENAIMVSDDLFISKLNNGIGIPHTTVNAIGLLYSEKLINIDELIEIVKDLSKRNFVNCVNHVMLYDIYNKLLESYGSEQFDSYFESVKEIFNNLFTEPSKEYHVELYQLFRDMVITNNKMTMMLYKLIQEPFGLKPYEELLQETLNNFRIQFSVVD